MYRKRKHSRNRKQKGKRKRKSSIAPYLILCIIILGMLFASARGYSLKNAAQTLVTYLLPGMFIVMAIVLLIPKTLRLIRHMKYRNSDLYQVDRMTGAEFEQYLTYLFQNKGYSVKQTPGSGDYGADLILEKKTGKGVKERTVIQAKRYQGKVGVTAVQEVIGAMHYYDADNAMVITNSLFTPNALNLAQKSHIVLWDRWQLKRNMK